MSEEFKKAIDEAWNRYYEAGQQEKMPEDILGVHQECFRAGADWAYEWCKKENQELKQKLDVAVKGWEKAFDAWEKMIAQGA